MVGEMVITYIFLRVLVRLS